MAPVHNILPPTGTIPKSNGTAREEPNERQTDFAAATSASTSQDRTVYSARSAAIDPGVPVTALRWDRGTEYDLWESSVEGLGEPNGEDESLSEFTHLQKLMQQQEAICQLERAQQRQNLGENVKTTVKNAMSPLDWTAAPSQFPNPQCLIAKLSQLQERMEVIRSFQPPRDGAPSPTDRSYLAEGGNNFNIHELSRERAHLMNKLKEFEANKSQQRNFLLHHVPKARNGCASDPDNYARRNSNSPSGYSSSSSTNAAMPSQPAAPSSSDAASLPPAKTFQQYRTRPRRDLDDLKKAFFHSKIRNAASHPGFAIEPANEGPPNEDKKNLAAGNDNLFDQVQSLRHEVESLREFVASTQRQPRPRQRECSNVDLPLMVQQQQWQIHQLTQSISQCYQVLLALQRETSSLRLAVENQSACGHVRSNESNAGRSSGASGLGPNTAWIVGNRNGGSDGNDDDGHNDHDHQSARQAPINPFEGGHPWQTLGQDMNRTYSDPNRRMSVSSGGLNAIGESDSWGLFSNQDFDSSRVSSSSTACSVRPNVSIATSIVGARSSESALNNQVPPGMRTNNYWDNFRSYSRQNRLSTVAPNVATSSHQTIAAAAATPIIAQVTPRQLQSSVDQLRAAATSGPVTAAGGVVRNGRHSALVEPYFSNLSSPSRPKRKQKINREQNKETGLSFGAKRNVSSSQPAVNELNFQPENIPPLEPRHSNRPFPGRDMNSAHNSNAAARVFPMPHFSEQPSPDTRMRNVNTLVPEPSQQELDYRDISRASGAPEITSITRSIYSQINHLITRHEASPDRLEQIFRDLQLISREDNLAVKNVDTNLTSRSNTSTTNTTSGLVGALRQLEDDLNVNASNLNNSTNSSGNHRQHWMDRPTLLDDRRSMSLEEDEEAMFKLTVNQRLAALAISDGERLQQSSRQNNSDDASRPNDADQPSADSPSQLMFPRKRRANNRSHEDLVAIRNESACNSITFNDVAVPKNAQRNRDAHGKCQVQSAVKKEKPRNANRCLPITCPTTIVTADNTKVSTVRPERDYSPLGRASDAGSHSSNPDVEIQIGLSSDALEAANGYGEPKEGPSNDHKEHELIQSEMAEADQVRSTGERPCNEQDVLLMGAASLDYSEFNSELAEDETFSFRESRAQEEGPTLDQVSLGISSGLEERLRIEGEQNIGNMIDEVLEQENSGSLEAREELVGNDVQDDFSIG